ncbi:cyclic nucleotide-binding domain-containing protein [Halobacillus fulvus]|nr:cyclic nucleotide-binding domain-containing protein [Halobacillus fulvus]
MKVVQDSERLQKYADQYGLEKVFTEASKRKMNLWKFEKGDILCSRGEQLDHMYFLVSGKVKIFTVSPEGKALIVRFKTPFAIIGDVEYVKGTELFHTVEAVNEGYMISLSFQDLRNYEDSHVPFLHFLLDVVTHKFYTESQATTLNMLYPVDVRLASYLLSLTDDGKESLYHKEMHTSTLQEIAEVIGTSYRHLNRILLSFHERGIIRREKGAIEILNLELLRERAKGNIYE